MIKRDFLEPEVFWDVYSDNTNIRIRNTFDLGQKKGLFVISLNLSIL